MRRFVLAAVAAAVNFTPAPFPKAERKRAGQPDVEGQWKFLVWEEDGQRQQHLEATYGARLTRESFVTLPWGAIHEMKFDATASPPAFTWSTRESLTHVGSYRLEGDRLQMVFVSGQDVRTRPTDVTTPPPNGVRYVMQRESRD